MIYDVIIIGAGPSGIGAAVELARHTQRVCIIERNVIGGLVRNAHCITNYLGFPSGISGKKFVRQLSAQLRTTNTKIISATVNHVEMQNNVFCVTTNHATLQAYALIVASGTQPVVFSDGAVPSECASRIMYEVFPIARVREKTIAIVGAGDAACDYALTLAPHNAVVLLNRSEKPKCTPRLWRDVVDNVTHITYHAQTRITAIAAVRRGMHITCATQGTPIEIIADYLVCAIGRIPTLDFLSQSLRENADNLEAQHRMFIVGDARHPHTRQTAIAVGDGVMAGMKIMQNA